jgi:hypothetical protein
MTTRLVNTLLKKALMAWYEVLIRLLRKGADKNHKHQSGWPVSKPRFETATYRIRRSKTWGILLERYPTMFWSLFPKNAILSHMTQVLWTLSAHMSIKYPYAQQICLSFVPTVSITSTLLLVLLCHASHKEWWFYWCSLLYTSRFTAVCFILSRFLSDKFWQSGTRSHFMNAIVNIIRTYYVERVQIARYGACVEASSIYWFQILRNEYRAQALACTAGKENTRQYQAASHCMNSQLLKLINRRYKASFF